MITDTLTRIYEFNVNEQRLADTLIKYNYDTAGIYYLIRKMQQTKVTWINSFDYYVNDQTTTIDNPKFKTCDHSLYFFSSQIRSTGLFQNCAIF
jgi:hypothetical protein